MQVVLDVSIIIHPFFVLVIISANSGALDGSYLGQIGSDNLEEE